jgi:Fic-DOC domain mobile mystery protein B
MADHLWKAKPGQTELSEREKLDLIPSLITRSQLNEYELLNTASARDWAMSPNVQKRDDLLTDFFARELHRRMFSSVWKWAGKYRTTERNLGWEPHRITEGMRVAFDNARHWVKHDTYSITESAVRLHYQLVAIHPWSNGNGRHARLIADVFMVSRGNSELPWGGTRSDLVNAGTARYHYIEALRKADSGTFQPLLDFCSGR